MRAAAAALLLLSSCATPEGPPPAPPAPPRLVVPEDLRRCLPPLPPPPVPDGIRTPERVATYAWGEAKARWQTAERLVSCAAKLQRLNEWVAAQQQ